MEQAGLQLRGNTQECPRMLKPRAQEMLKSLVPQTRMLKEARDMLFDKSRQVINVFAIYLSQ